MRLATTLTIAATLLSTAAAADQLPRTVSFPSADGRTMLIGYLYLPTGPHPARSGAVVMMHGRAGAYSSLAAGEYDAHTLTRRHKFWGEHWAKLGYAALLVDGFGPRGYPAGFAAHTHEDRPETVNELSVRPLDAYGALAWLRTRTDVDPGHIVLQGWSNGGSATIATLSDAILADLGLTPSQGFRGAVAFYPACGLYGAFATRYRPYAALRIFSGDADEEVSAKTCAKLVETSLKDGGDIGIEILPGATHDFDDPGQKRQSVPANAEALRLVEPQVTAYVRSLMGR